MYTLVLDHLIIAVDNLDTAMEDYRSLGFRVMYGGKHASGTTHNAIVPFADGIYLELIALTGESASNTSDTDFANFFENGEGSAGYGLYTDDLNEDVNDMRERGVLVTPIQIGSRELPDGRVVKWRIAYVNNSIFPLFLQDETPRKWRVPDIDRYTNHENGVKGVSQVIFVVDDLHTGIAKYRAILGVPPQVDHHSAYFLLESSLLKISVPMNSDMEAHLKARKDAPYEIHLRVRGGKDEEGELDIAKTRGIRMIMVK